MQSALPIEDYKGTYYHKGYGTLTLSVRVDHERDKLLWCDTSDRAWGSSLTFKHVNAENWLVAQPFGNSSMLEAVKAETKVGSNGKVMKIGVAMENAMPHHLFWFDRTDAALPGTAKQANGIAET